MKTNKKSQNVEPKNYPATIFSSDEHRPDGCYCDECVLKAQRAESRERKERSKEGVNRQLVI